MGAPDTVKHPQRIIVEQRLALAELAAEWIAEAITGAVAERGRCAIALSGGTTPRAVYARLARHHAEVPWPHVDVYFGDERCVPPHHPESNFYMADQILLRHVPIPRAQIHRMPAEWRDDEAAAREYDQVLPDALDVLLLGMGADGHTASLFPGSRALDERDRWVIPVDAPAGITPPHRITLTLPILNRAREVFFLVAGADKRPAISAILTGGSPLPAAQVRGVERTLWLLDRAAAPEVL